MISSRSQPAMSSLSGLTEEAGAAKINYGGIGAQRKGRKIHGQTAKKREYIGILLSLIHI